MSAVLMCDSCGQIFSVNQKGWKEFTESIPSSESNPYNVGKRQQHIGPCCLMESGNLTPRVGPSADEKRILELEKANERLAKVTQIDEETGLVK